VIDVLIVAPYASVLAGIRALLAGFDQIAVLGEARDTIALAQQLDVRAPDVILYDASTGDLNAVLTAASGHELGIVTMSDNSLDLGALARQAEHGWCALRRSAAGEEIAAGIQAAAVGLIALDNSFADSLVPTAALDPATGADHEAGDAVLTARELEVLQLMTHGLPNKVIASRLHISLSTAKFHVASILSKLDAESRTEAVTIGARRGLVSL
jgi:DNA-binding NarL/FixJ family response regulator